MQRRGEFLVLQQKTERLWRIDPLITDNAAQERQRCGIKVTVADGETIRGLRPHLLAWMLRNAPQRRGGRR